MTNPVSIGPCYHCKEPMWMSQASYDTYLRNHQTFYCTHGHGQCFAKGESELTKVRRERDQLKQRIAYKDDCLREDREAAEHERRRANSYKGHATKMTKRAKAGVCPCCNRTFKQLAQHMASQHPEFTPIEVDQVPQGATVQ